MLVNYLSALPDYSHGNRLEALIQSDRLSFLSLRESLKPISTIRQIFLNSRPNCWKPLLLKDIREALFDPLFFMMGNSNDLREFADYIHLNKLLEAAFLLNPRQSTWEESAPHWSLLECRTDPLEWGCTFYANGGIKDALASLAFIGHYRRYHTDWHPSAGLLILRHYWNIYRLIHMAHWLAGQSVEPHGALVVIQRALIQKLKSVPIGVLSRFLNLCLLDARGYNRKSWRRSSEHFKIQALEEILHLCANYFSYYKSQSL